MKKLPLFLIVLFLFHHFSGICQNDISSYLQKADQYLRSLSNGKADIIHESYRPENSTSDVPQFFRKRIWHIGYAFDQSRQTVRIDKTIVIELDVKAENGYPTDSVVCKKDYDNISNEGTTELGFYSADLCVVINPSSNRTMVVQQNPGKKNEHSILFDPGYWTRNFLLVLKGEDKRNFTIDLRKHFLLFEETLHNDIQVVIQSERLVKTGSEPDPDIYTHIIHKFWVNKNMGIVEKIRIFRALISRQELELNRDGFSVRKGLSDNNLSFEEEIHYDKSLPLPFPDEILRKVFMPGINEAKKPVPALISLDKFSFDNIKINIPNFSVCDFFLYPEKETNIFSYPQNIPLTKTEYGNLFSYLNIEKDKIIGQNMFIK